MDKSILNLDVPDERLDEMYSGKGPDGDYYWYLKSPEFREAFIKPIAQICDQLGKSVLDVACGEAWLASHLYASTRYTGLEGSTTAVETARNKYPERHIINARIENPPPWLDQHDVVVIGGVLGVLIKTDRWLEFCQCYIQLVTAKYLVIYDLDEYVPDDLFDRQFRWIHKFRRRAAMPNLQEIKRDRKVLVYEV